MAKPKTAAVTVTKLEEASGHYRAFMQALGLPLNEETDSTPYRVARMFSNEFCSHNGSPPDVALFKRKNYDQYIVVKDIEFVSLCEHHHMVFEGVVHVGYHPKEWLAGLSKIARVVKYFSGRPQLQEHLVVQIAEYLFKMLTPHGVMVVAEARHSCMSCRGIRSARAQTVTSKLIEAAEGIDKSEMMRLMGL